MRKTKWVGLLLTLALILGLGFVVTSCGTTEVTTTEAPTTTVTIPDTGQDYEFIFSHAMSPMASLYSTYLMPWTKAVQDGSNGRITITEYPDSELYDEPLQFPNLIAGEADLTLISTEFVPGELPVFELAYMPMLFPNPEVATRVMWDILNEYAQDELKDVQMLGLVCLTPSEYCGLQPVHVPADMAGLKFRSAGSAEHDTMAALGATPVDTEVPAFVYWDNDTLSLQKTKDLVVPFDGIFLSWAYMNVTGANTWATNFTQADLQYRMFILAMNKEKWDSLPTVIQEMFLGASGLEQSVVYNNDNVAVNETGDNYAADVAAAEAAGNAIYMPTEDEKALWQAAVQPVLDEWVTDYASKLPAQEIMDKVKELVDKYSTDQG